MSIRRFVNDPYLVPNGTYVTQISAVRQKVKDGRSWTVVCFEIVDGYFKCREIFDILRRSGFSREAVGADRAREHALVALCPLKRGYTRACRDMIGTLVEVEVDSRWRTDLERRSNVVKRYRAARQF